MKTIMIQGTGSGVGKSILTAGICRLLSNAGIKVAPFKAQNMALNSGVVKGNLEIGRAQILQAEAARIEPDVRMNPILLKPQGHSVSQLIRMGKVHSVNSAVEYYRISQENFEIVKKAYDDLKSEYDVIVIEGAGSPAEINLQKTDIVNMRMAQYANADVYIVGDIDRGGVFAWMKGTYDLVPVDSKKLIKGFIVNRFRGDFSLLKPGIEMFEDIVPIKIVGTIPYFNHTLEEEDSQDISLNYLDETDDFRISVIKLPHISNFSDFTPLKSLKGVQLEYITSPEQLDKSDMIIIPGSKSTIYDLKFLKKSGFAVKLKELYGKTLILGICGGFQMLGKSISDPQGIEGTPCEESGLNLLEMATTMTDQKVLDKITYIGASKLEGIEFSGYEIHMGQTKVLNHNYTQLSHTKNIFLYDSSSKVIGTYIHGLFESGAVAKEILTLCGKIIPEITDYQLKKENDLDNLASLIKEHMDVKSMFPDTF